MTIGKELKHIEDARLDDVRAFFFKHYRPVNAVLCVAGNVSVDQVKELTEKWFADIPAGDRYIRKIEAEPDQVDERVQTVFADVPLDALYKSWHIPGRLALPYYACDLITEIMGNGYASRLYQRLVKEQQLFSNISCYHTGSLDPGLLIVEGKIVEGRSVEEANAAVEHEMKLFADEGITDVELTKAKNKIEAMIEFEDMSLLSRANNLAFYELLGDAALINTELERYQTVSAALLQETAKTVLRRDNCSTLFYRKTVAEQKQ
jgi:predicted Zn-dependent peptidase